MPSTTTNLPFFHVLFIVALLYEQVGSKSITDFADAQQLLDSMPSAKMELRNSIGRFLDTEDGVLLLKEIATVVSK